MTIAIFHNEKTMSAARIAGELIQAHTQGITFHDSGKVWDKEYCKNPIMLLDKVSHAFFFYSDVPLDQSVFLFLSGYCLGKGIRVVVIETDKKIPLPENARHLAMVLPAEKIEEYIHAEKIRYLKEDKQARARETLLAKGMPCFDENFVLTVESGDVEMAGLFLEAGFSPSLTDARNVPLLSIAVRGQYVDLARMLIAAGAEIDRQSGDRHYSPLMDAAQKGDSAMVELLLENGSNPNLTSKDGQTALIVCSGRGDYAMASVLVRYGADPEIKDQLGMSAAGYARLFKNEKLMELFNIQPA